MCGLVFSFLLHVVVVAAALTALPHSELLPALFIDLAASGRGEQRGRPAMATSGSQPSRPAAAPRRQSPASIAPLPVQAPRPEPPEPEPLPLRPESPVAERPWTVPELSPSPEPEPAAPTVQPPLASPDVAPAEVGPAGAVGAAPPDTAPAPGHSAAGEIAASPAASDGVAVGRDHAGSDAADAGDEAIPPGQEVARSSPTGEGGDALPGVYTDYLARLRQRIHEALRYPPAARRRGLTGAVTVELTVLPSGAISDVRVVQSSSHSLLDDAAVEAVQELRPQRFPANVPARPLRVRLPVVFQLE